MIDAQTTLEPLASGMDAFKKLVDSGVLVAIFVLIVKWGPKVGTALLDRDDSMRKQQAEAVATFVEEQKKDRHHVGDQVERVVLLIEQRSQMVLDQINAKHEIGMTRLGEHSADRREQLTEMENRLNDAIRDRAPVKKPAGASRPARARKP